MTALVFLLWVLEDSHELFSGEVQYRLERAGIAAGPRSIFQCLKKNLRYGLD